MATKLITRDDKRGDAKVFVTSFDKNYDAISPILTKAQKLVLDDITSKYAAFGGTTANVKAEIIDAVGENIASKIFDAMVNEDHVEILNDLLGGRISKEDKKALYALFADLKQIEIENFCFDISDITEIKPAIERKLNQKKRDAEYRAKLTCAR